MKKIVSFLIICIVVVLSFFYAHIDYNSYIYDRNADTGTFYGTGVLAKNEIVTQTFVAEEDTIDGLNVKVAISGNADAVLLQCSVLDHNQEEVAFVQIKGSELENNKFNKIEIPTIADTKDKQFTIVLSSENSDDLNGIGFYVANGRGEEQSLNVKGNETDGTLVARIISHRFDVETFVMVLVIVGFVFVFMKILYKFFK